MKEYLKLIRIKHYIKNLLIFLPIFFSKEITDVDKLKDVFIGFIAFCLLSSIIYIFNDLLDLESDKKHPEKCKRPIASGKISKTQAIVTMIILAIILNVLIYFVYRTELTVIAILATYLILNILYTLKLKEIPIVDIATLAVGFLMRVILGAEIIHISISNYLYLTILTIAFYMGMGKRRNEIIKINTEGETRKVLKAYNQNFLNENMYMFLALAIFFYSLWCIDLSSTNNYIMYTIPFVMAIAMKYSLSIEQDSYGDPVDVLLKDKILLILFLILSIIIGIILYR